MAVSSLGGWQRRNRYCVQVRKFGQPPVSKKAAEA
jgi:hypothetical protein